MQYTKIQMFETEKCLKELKWMCDRNVTAIDVADSNFGIFPRDEKLVDFVVSQKKLGNFNGRFMPTWAKTHGDKIMKLAKKLQDANVDDTFGFSLQSTNPETLDNVNRRNAFDIKSFKPIIKDLKDKYISEWTWDDWDIYWQKVNDWYYAGWEEEQAEDNWEDEYAYEDDYDIDAELEQWLADVDNQWDCEYYGYYWDKANSACGTEWVDNSAAETEVTASGETLNYSTGEVTQTLTSTSGVTGASSSATATGRVSTLNNDFDATASTSGDYTILNRYNDNHRSYVKTETANEADIQILQDKEAQHLDVGNSAAQNEITIIQTD